MRKSISAKRRPHFQLSLVRRKNPTDSRGGARPGAGRPRKPGAVSHDKRDRLQSRFPQHVTLRVVSDAPSLAREWLMKIIRRAIRQAHKPGFRVVHFNVLANHVHFITEASGNDELARGMQGLQVRLARRLNAALIRKGKLFAERFHARYLKSPREVRNCIRYVLLNRKHHDAERQFAPQWFDPYSSAAWFDGWSQAIAVDTRWKYELVSSAAPTAAAKTWLLRVGWRRHGALRFDERPS